MTKLDRRRPIRADTAKLADKLILLLLALTIGICAWRLWGKTPVSPWDEIHVYLGYGNKSLSGMLLDAEWSPLYIFWYFLLSHVTSVPPDLLYLNQAVLPCVMLLAWYFLLRRLKWPAAAAALTVLLLAAQPTTWLSEIKVHHFSLFLSSLFAAGILFFRERNTQLLLTPPAVALLVFTRPEMILLFPFCLIAYLIFYFFSRPRPAPSQLLRFLQIFACSFMMVLATGALSGHKAGETYFKKQWERLDEIGKNHYHSEVELQKDLFPGATNALSALFVNPALFGTHSFFHLKKFFFFQKKFFEDFFRASPPFFGGVIFVILIGILCWFRRRQMLFPNKHTLITASCVLFLIFIPHFLLALVYGTLERYNIATLFVVATFLSLPLLALSGVIQRVAAVALFTLFWVTMGQWNANLIAARPNGFWNHYSSFYRQFNGLVLGEKPRILTNCGTIWIVATKNPGYSDSFELMLNSNRYAFQESIAQTLEKFDVAIFCRDAYTTPNRDKIKKYEDTIAARTKEFHRYTFEPFGATVFVRPALLTGSPLPKGVTAQ